MNIKTAIEQAYKLAEHFRHEPIEKAKPILLQGACGLGKTDTPKTVAQMLNLPYHEIRAAEMEPTDWHLPVPDMKANVVRMMRTERLPDVATVMNFDEISQASSDMTSVLLSIFYGGTIGDYKLPDGTVLFATGNRVQDRAGCKRLTTALRERCIVIDIEAHTPSWLEWYADNDPHPDVMHYIQANPNLLHVFDAKVDSNQPSPRNWVRTGEVLNCTDHEEVISGVIGKEYAAGFLKWRRTNQPIPEVVDVLQGKSKRPTSTLQMTGWIDKLITAAVSMPTKGVTHRKIASEVKKLKPAFQVKFLKLFAKRDLKLAANSAYASLLDDNGDAIEQAVT